jgi:hypothetical protein
MPNKNKPKVKPVRVNVSAVKHSSSTRTDCAQVVSTNGPSSAIWQTVPEVQLAGTTYLNPGRAGEVTTPRERSQINSTARSSSTMKASAAAGLRATYHACASSASARASS